MKRPLTPLEWDDVDENWHRAIGAKGTYDVQQFTHERWILSGLGHDGLPMMELPATERMAFRSAESAQAYAADIDRRPATGEMSGC